MVQLQHVLQSKTITSALADRLRAGSRQAHPRKRHCCHAAEAAVAKLMVEAKNHAGVWIYKWGGS